MKASKLREMSAEELVDQENELVKQLFHLRFQLAAGQLDNARKILLARRDLARVKTVRNEMSRAAKAQGA